jgi:hypothetical protein
MNMERKVCVKCNVEKPLDEFVKRNDSPNGFRACCKVCYNNHKKEKRNSSSQTQKEKIKKYHKDYFNLNRDKITDRNRDYRKNNREKELNRHKKYREENPEKYRESILNYKKNNKEKIKEDAKVYYQNNKDKRRIYENIRHKTDSIYRITNSVRSRINLFVKSKNIRKNNTTFNIIGCTPEFFKEHLERQFKDNMNWDNYGLYGWHIDHIIPLSSAKTEEEIYKLCHYTNLQPLWAEENLKKSNKLIII